MGLLHGPLRERVFVGDTRRIPLLDVDVEIEYIIWVELLLASVLCYNVSFVGHLSGILAGLAVGYGAWVLEAIGWMWAAGPDRNNDLRDEIDRVEERTRDYGTRDLNAVREGSPGREPAREDGTGAQDADEAGAESANPSPEEMRAARLAKYEKTREPKEPRREESKLARWKKESKAREAAARDGGPTIRAGVLERPHGRAAQAEQPGQSPELSSHFSRAQRASAEAIRQRSLRSPDGTQELADNLASAADRTASERQQLLRQARRREGGFRNVH